jgi:hypothetical protein
LAQSLSINTPNYVIPPKQLKLSAQKGATVFLVQLHLVGMGDSARETVSVENATSWNVSGTHCEGPANKESPSALQALLGLCTDAFPEEVPKGLPPERSVQMNIKLLPDSIPIKSPNQNLLIDGLKEVKS